MKIYFLNGNTPEIEYHYLEKEYRNDVIVEIEGLLYDLYFFTIDALQYKMTKDGFFSLSGMIILDEISTENIKKSILTLYERKFFFINSKGKKNLIEIYLSIIGIEMPIFQLLIIAL